MVVDEMNQRVVFIGDPGPVQQQITAALNAQADFTLVDVLSSVERLFREIHAAEAGLIMVDSTLGGQSTLDMIDDLSIQFPNSAIIAILPEYDPMMIQQVNLAGARAFLVQPFTQVNLLSTLRRVQELENRRVKGQANTGSAKQVETHALRSVAVFSPRGGSGTTTIAINLAISMYEQTGAKVLLIDGKLFFGHLDVMLNIRARNTVADLIPHVSALDEALVREVVVQHVSGIHILLAPTDVQIAQGIRPDDLYGVFVGLQRFYDLIVIDAGSNLSENTVTLMDAADRILLVTTPDLAALHDTSRFIQISRSLSYPADKILLILNRVGQPGGVKPQDIEASLRIPAFAQIQDDGPDALRSINRGIPIYLRYTRSPVSRAIKQLAGRMIMNGSAPSPAKASASGLSTSQKEALLASSQLG
jgi:pilus assembly protein CpaE